jgi:hypothetical protein
VPDLDELLGVLPQPLCSFGGVVGLLWFDRSSVFRFISDTVAKGFTSRRLLTVSVKNDRGWCALYRVTVEAGGWVIIE